MGTSPLKHGGDKKIQFNFQNFKPKSIAQTVSEVQLNSHLQQLTSKQNRLKGYKYYQDFDRISVQQTQEVASFQHSIQNLIKFSFMSSILFTRMYIAHLYHSQGAFSLYKKYYLPVTACVFSVGYIAVYFSQHGHVSHDNFFRQQSPQEQGYRALDQYMNLYQYVDDIKYKFDYGRSNILRTRQKYYKGFLAHMENQIYSKDPKVNQKEVI